MAVATKKRKEESNEKLIGRWKKKTRQARVVQEVRAKKHFKKSTSKTKEKKSAIVREKYRTERKKNRFYS